MILFLTSSPCLYQVSPATLTPANGFLKRIKSKLPPRPRTLFVASSPDDVKLTAFYAADMAGAFQRAGIEFDSFRVLDRDTRRDASKLICWADFIVMMGGHVPTQNAFFNEIGLKRLLRGFPGVVMGISAGTMNAAEEVYAQPEEPGESVPSFRRFYPGLGLTDINVCPHYQQVRDMILDGKHLFRDITSADSMGRSFYVFPDGTYIYKDEKEYAILGECYLLRDGVMEKLSEEGGRIDLPR